MDTAIIIPAINEEKRLGEVVRGCVKYGEVFVVDDGSVDNTSTVARRAGAQVLKLSKNKGKGYALRVGIKRAIKKNPKHLVFIDGDGQHRPEDIPKFIEKLKDHQVVFGKRIEGEMPFIKVIGNWGLQVIFNVLFGSWFEDTQCGFRAFRSNVFDTLSWKSDRYFVDTEIAARISQSKFSKTRVKIPVIYHDVKKGTTVLDGLSIGVKMIRLKLRL